MSKKQHLPSLGTNLHNSGYLPETLLPTKKIIEQARKKGVDFGPGNAEERIRYYIKLGLLPHAVRLIPASPTPTQHIAATVGLPAKAQATTGHLPFSAISTLKEVNRLKLKGLSYPQISKRFRQAKVSREKAVQAILEKPPTESSPTDLPTPATPPSAPGGAKIQISLWKKMGLSDREIEEKLKEHAQKIEENLKKQLEIQIQNLEAFQPVPARKAALVPTDKIIEEAKKSGIDFGPGKAGERIRYFIKLGLLPNAVRKAVISKNGAAVNVGHHPQWTLNRLKVIDRLNHAGMSYPKIARKFQRIEKRQAKEESKQPASAEVSLSEKTSVDEVIEKRLAKQQAEIEKRFDELKSATSAIARDTRDITKHYRNYDFDSERSNMRTEGRNTPETLSITESDLKTLAGYTYAPPVDIPKTHKVSLLLPADSIKPSPYPVKRVIIISSLSFLLVLGSVGSLFVPHIAKNTLQTAKQSKELAQELGTSDRQLGTVLAVSSEANRLYIDATTEVKGETTFLDDITAPNVTYSVTGSTGISVTGGQNPVVALDTTDIVTSVNTSSGDLTIKGSGATSVTTSGATITISTSSASGDITAVTAGNGLTGGGSSGDVTLAVSLTTSGTSSTTSSASGLEFSSGLSLLRGCSNSQTLAWTASTTSWDCSSAGSSVAWSAITNPTADLSLTFDDGEQNSFTVSSDTEDFWTFTASSLTTGSLLVATGSTTTGITDHFIKVSSDVGSGASLLNLNPDFSGSTVTSYGIYNTATDATANTNTDYGYYGSLTFSGAGGATGYGIYSIVTASNKLESGTYSGYFATSATATITSGTTSTYGVYSAPAASGANTGGTTSVYGTYIAPSSTNATTGSTNNIYGSYIETTGTLTTGGTINQYGLYVANGTSSATGTSTKYGLYMEAQTGADTNYGAYLNSSSGEALTIVATNTSQDVASITASSLSTGTALTFVGPTSTGVTDHFVKISSDIGSATALVNLNPDFSGSGVTAYGIYNAATDSTSNANSDYGYYGTLTLTGNAAKTGYGIYQTVTSTSTTADTLYGQDILVDHNAAAASGNKTLYGLRSQVTNDGITDSAGTHNIYGGYFSATGNTGGTQTAYGFYSTATTADTAYGGFISFTPQSASGSYYGLYIQQENSDNTNDITNLLLVHNNDTNLGVSNAIEVTSLGGGITDAVDLDDTDIVNAINIGDNIFLMNTTRFVEAVSGTTTLEDTGGTDLWNASTTTFQINLTDADQPERLCHSGIDGATGVVSIGDCAIGGEDFAEYFGSDGQLQAQDVVVLEGEASSQDHEKYGYQPKTFVKKSTEPYEGKLIGIVSTNPYSEVLGGRTFTPEEHPVPIALSGQVPVKVNTESGPIKRGDSITSSSAPGIGMKATKYGPVIGMALQNYDGAGIGSVIVFVNPGFYYGENLAGGVVNGLDLLTLGTQEGFYNTNGSLKDIFKDQILTADQIDEMVRERVAIELAEYLATSDRQLATSNPDATSSAVLASASQRQFDELNTLLAGTNATLEGLTVTGNANLAQTQVAGTLSQDGTFIIDYGKQVNVLGSTLFLQNDGLSGDQTTGILVDIGSGKAAIDKFGNLVLIGELATKGIAINTDIANPTAGSGTIASGQKSTVISTTSLKPGAKVLVTPTTDTGAQSLFISQKTDYEDFTVAVTGLAAPLDIKFDWLIINTTEISQNQAI